MSELEVYKAINAVSDDIAKIGIDKSRQGYQYKFRGIDDVYNALAPLLAKHKLIILPNVLDKNIETKEIKNNGKIKTSLHVVLTVEYNFISAVDGSSVVVRTYGEALDQSDKATNKAMSAAYKYACFQAFCIPLEGDNDTENNELAYNKISTKDASLIKQMLKQTGSDVKAFLNHIKAQDVDSMTEAQAKTAIHLLQQKVKRQQK